MACSLVGTCAAVVTLGTVQPFSQKEPAPHTVTAPQRSTPLRGHRRPYNLVSGRLLSGIGSWYGDFFDGRLTASGEVFDQDALTACHPTLPFGTLVRVVNLKNRRSVVVRINDRGIRPDRVIDLSSAAAEKIGLIDMGVAPVKLEIVAKRS